MDEKRKYTNAEVKSYLEAVKREYELTIARQRERIDELRKALDAAQRQIAENENQKELVYKAITTALKKADDIERVSLIKYNQEIAQLKSFHDKWIGYFNKIIEKYPLTDELVAASKASGKIAEVLNKSGDIEAQYNEERDRLEKSIERDEAEAERAEQAKEEKEAKEREEKENIAEEKQDDIRETASVTDDEYTDRSPAGFSFAEALHPKQDLKDIMKELGVLIDDE